jgi:dolichol-phosphate mannosyltransferase
MDANPPFLSLVIPCFNEHENVEVLLSRVDSALAALGKPFEVILVDDGSTDDTPRLLKEGMTRYPWLRVLRMAKNGGQSAAFEAGFAAARGGIIATIDADLQNDPEEIPRLVPLLDEHHVDMITGWRKDRQDTQFRKWQSRQANRIRNWVTQETVHDSASSLKIYRAHAVKGMKLFRGAHRYFPTLVKMRGYTVYGDGQVRLRQPGVRRHLRPDRRAVAEEAVLGLQRDRGATGLVNSHPVACVAGLTAVPN